MSDQIYIATNILTKGQKIFILRPGMEIIFKSILLVLPSLRAPFLVLCLSYYVLMTFLIMMLPKLFTLYFKCDQTSDLWQQFKLASKLESDLQDTLGCGRKQLIGFNAGKIRLLFDFSHNCCAIDVKADGSVFEKK